MHMFGRLGVEGGGVKRVDVCPAATDVPMRKES